MDWRIVGYTYYVFNPESIRLIATVVAGILYVVAVVPYLISLYKKEIRPHPVSWLLWTIIGFVNVLLYRQTGATYTQVLSYMAFFLPLIIFIFSFPAWRGTFSKVDYFCLCVSILSVVLGLVYKNPVLGLTLNLLLADFIAYFPTVIKTFKDPKSENVSTWLITIIANILTISVIGSWTFAIALLPIYTFIMNGVVLFAILKKRAAF